MDASNEASFTLGICVRTCSSLSGFFCLFMRLTTMLSRTLEIPTVTSRLIMALTCSLLRYPFSSSNSLLRFSEFCRLLLKLAKKSMSFVCCNKKNSKLAGGISDVITADGSKSADELISLSIICCVLLIRVANSSIDNSWRGLISPKMSSTLAPIFFSNSVHPLLRSHQLKDKNACSARFSSCALWSLSSSKEPYPPSNEIPESFSSLIPLVLDANLIAVSKYDRLDSMFSCRCKNTIRSDSQYSNVKKRVILWFLSSFHSSVLVLICVGPDA
ncbi:hypothetical protein OGAPHI_001803 [Ogataea philodendri]|uniref:Uncharacterized protein n=1 Tax=Ogataea philodendri TaxID=1378263 RepID=A0A9P8PAS2_9ASCO|nr:uncharacterized protein OGAPHI_001803 [Ogataea philodendri]KAH3668049.1 hypothetical protein OGAPHI_001803 [Ogataea philodendri]